jgi:uncharacterized membrane protein YGL010W
MRNQLQYGSYHHNKVNVAIHILCVPLILFSGFCMVSISHHKSLGQPTSVADQTI